MIIALMCVHDDSDILLSSMDWYLNNGVDGFGIVKHRITEESQEILSLYEKDIVSELTVTEPAFNQEDWLYTLRQRVNEILSRSYQKELWHIHCDTDERWLNLRSLRHCGSSAMVVNTYPWLNFLPYSVFHHSLDNAKHYEVFPRTMSESVTGYFSLSKVAIRGGVNAKTEKGNHKGWRIDDEGNPATTCWERAPITIEHYPVRSYWQFARKVKAAVSGLSFMKDDNDPRSCHWQKWVQLLKEDKLEETYKSMLSSPDNLEKFAKEGKVILTR